MSLRLFGVLLGTVLATMTGCSETASDVSTEKPEPETRTSITGDDRGKHVEWKHAFFGFTYGGPGAQPQQGAEPSPAPKLVFNIALTNRADYCTALGKLR